jgi:hypothetical protein
MINIIIITVSIIMIVLALDAVRVCRVSFFGKNNKRRVSIGWWLSHLWNTNSKRVTAKDT